MKKRTFRNGLRPDRERVLLTIRSRFENLQRQRRKSGGRKEAGYAFVAEAGERPGGKCHSSSGARGRWKGRGGRGRGGAGITMKRRKNNTRRPAARMVGVKPTAPRETAHSVRAAARRNTNPSADLIRSAVCVVVKIIRGISAPTSSLACEDTKYCKDDSDAAINCEEKQAFVCDMSGKYSNGSNDEGSCSALAWQVGNLTVICDSGASCHMSHLSTRIINYRESNAYMRTASGARYLIEDYGDLPLTFRSSSGDVPPLL